MAAVLHAKGFMSCSTILREACLKSPGNKVATKLVTDQRLGPDLTVSDLLAREHVLTKPSIGAAARVPKIPCVRWPPGHCTGVLLLPGEPEAALHSEDVVQPDRFPASARGRHGTSGGMGP